MLSLVFWLSLAGVFFGMTWLANGLMALARVEIRRVAAAPVAARFDNIEVASPTSWREDASSAFDEAA